MSTRIAGTPLSLTIGVLCLPGSAFSAEEAVQKSSQGYGTADIVLSVLLLVVLGLLFYLVFRWSQRSEQASYLGRVFYESVFDFELSRRTRRIEEKLRSGEYRREVLSQDQWFQANEYPEPPKPSPALRAYMRRSRQAGSRRPGWHGHGHRFAGPRAFDRRVG